MKQSKTQERNFAAKFSRNYLLILLISAGILFFNIIKIFFVPILLAIVFCALFFPLYELLLKWTKRRESLSSLLCCVILLLGLLIPIYIITNLVSQETIALYNSAKPKIEKLIERGDEGILGELKKIPIIQRFNFDNADLQKAMQNLVRNIGNILTDIINKTSRGTFKIVTDLFITLFTMFYFFKDGQKIIKKIKYLSPLDDIYEEGLIHRFVSVSRATIKGTILIGLIQGSLGGLTLWITGVGSPILWGVVMIILSVIPVVGAWLVLYPAATIQLVLGHTWQGVTIFVMTMVVISNIDNLLRPRLVGRDARMHDLIIFFSTLGGLGVFGIMGFIIGPVIAVSFLTILDIYSIEFKSTLDMAMNSDFHPTADEEKENSSG